MRSGPLRSQNAAFGVGVLKPTKILRRRGYLVQSGSEKGVLLEKGSFQKSPFSRVSREFRDSRDFIEILENPAGCGK